MAAIQPHQLGEAQAGAVHHLQHGAIAHRQRIVEIDLQQLVHFIDVDVFRQMAAATRRADAFGGVGVQYARLTSQSRKLRNEESRSAAGGLQAGAFAARRQHAHPGGVQRRPVGDADLLRRASAPPAGANS